ncbi:MAG TPA: hypothetical protein VFK57_00825 [Vicinamibacterales bacterium]|nr:hypothetical protein [Vicinamibacterales bacterium]
MIAVGAVAVSRERSQLRIALALRIVDVRTGAVVATASGGA